MWFALILVVIFVGIVYTWLTWNVQYWRKRCVPEPKCHLLAGSFPKSFMQTLNMVYEVDAVYKLETHNLVLTLIHECKLSQEIAASNAIFWIFHVSNTFADDHQS